ncbi:DJ-1 family protein [Campylobacter sp. MIT 12-5580]|uniref:DJ-1 family glyoxalase III n=1 Tax=Campylobacter sp. MIT 12-5580 TaxID=2040651 RepID=UPI0010F7707C|nr:DJ-1 family glyoxalase III [Campylobacter sp. MIT 12-5580]TKX28657.1 DJ-1 family protein [Campylobacter sp. MIT 12-5580]
MKSVLVPIAKGFEEIELVSIVDILRRAGIKVCLASLNNEKLVLGAHNISIEAEANLEELDFLEFDAIALAGGLDGMLNLKADTRLLKGIQAMYEANKLVSAICASPVVLASAGVLKGDFTCYIGFEKDINANYQKKAVVVDKNIITAAGPAYAAQFALELVRYLCGEASYKSVSEGLLLNLF